MLAIFLAAGLVWVSAAKAHFIKGDGSVSVLLHVAPDDNPVVGQPSTLYLRFSDAERTFSGEQCDCTVLILKGGQKIFWQKLFLDDTKGSTATTFSFIFPEQDIYEIQIEGKPETEGIFPPFTSTYTLDVGRPSLPAFAGFVSRHLWHEGKFPPHALHVVGAGIAVVALSIMILRERLQQRNT